MDYFTAVRVFTRVVEAGSFVKAADSLQMPRNTVTKLIQSLETHLRVKLLNRTTRKVSPTNDGMAYYERMSRLLEEWQEVESQLANAQAHPRGRLRVDMPSLVATQVVIPALPTFQARYPDLQLDIGVSDRPIDLISEGVDCVVRAGKVTDPSLIARTIGEFPFVLCATEAYLASHGVPGHPVDLDRNHALIRYFYAGTGRQVPIELRSGHERVTVEGHRFVSFNDGNASLVAALAGLGVLHTLAVFAQPYVEKGELVRLLGQWSAEPVPISIVYSPNRHLSTRVRAFVDWMAELFAAHRPR
ncbi:MAG TPA: LysR family transcriptional regulator [Luteibacter sp.]|nr:LysR family transcriptional regulator [Luteibacter sp.]